MVEVGDGKNSPLPSPISPASPAALSRGHLWKFHSKRHAPWKRRRRAEGPGRLRPRPVNDPWIIGKFMEFS